MAERIFNINGVLYVSRVGSDGSVYTQRVNEDGTNWVDPGPARTQAEIESGIGMVGDAPVSITVVPTASGHAGGFLARVARYFSRRRR